MSETIPTAISTTVPATGRLEFVEAFVERFDGAPVTERRRWSDEFKADAVAAALVPGVNVSALARRLGVTAPQLFGWRKAHLDRLRRSVGSPVAKPPPAIELMIGDVTLRIAPDVSEEALRKFIRVVRSA